MNFPLLARRRIWAPLFLFLLAGCHSSPGPAAANGTPASHTFSAQGVIERIAPDRRQVTIHHDTIPGYMMEMTMDFPVNDPDDLKALVPGDRVVFSLVVETDRDWVTDFHRIGHIDPDDGMRMDFNPAPKLKPGDPVPDGELIAEDGRHVRLSDFRGKVVALTFFFTRCPLPNYCPLMNRNFAEARQLLAADPTAPARWQFLSISFDADFDRPQTLASYAKFYRGDNASGWLFAAAPPATLARLAPALGLVIMRQGPGISHNVRTVVVDPQGRLFRQFNDNLWTPRQLADAMLKAGGMPPPVPSKP